MKIKVFGYQGISNATNYVKQSFVDLGHEVTETGPVDLIFDLNGFFEDALNYKANVSPNAKTIFNLLNADVNNPNWPVELAREQLAKCDVPTTVSESTRKDILDRTGVNCEIIYYPMQPVSKLAIPRSLDFIYVGRLYNKEKRFNLVADTMKLLKYPLSSVVVAGPEATNETYNTGPINNNDLNIIYNSAKYLFCPCWREGSMSMLEAATVGTFPIVCNDNFWVSEFNLDMFAADPTPESLAMKIMDIEQNRSKYSQELDRVAPLIIDKFSSLNVAKKIIELYNKI